MIIGNRFPQTVKKQGYLDEGPPRGFCPDQPGPIGRRHSATGGDLDQSVSIRTPRTTLSRSGPRKPDQSAPVADPDRQSVYAAAPDGQIRKLALTDGHVLWATPITQLPAREKIAGALNFDGGHVLAATGGYIGEAPPYQGHVAVLDASSGQIVRVWNALCSDRAALIAPSSCPESGSAIWARRGVVVDPATHHLLLATGDGLYDGRIHWGDSVVELAADASALIGHWTPTNYRDLEQGDVDLGSTGPALLAGGYVAQSGKDGKLRLFQVARTTAAGTDGEAQTVSAPGSSAMHSDPAVGSGNWLFAATRAGTAAWRLVGNQLQQAWSNGTGGTSPVIAGGLLWVFDPGGSLLVYRPQTGERLAELPAGRGHWQSPIVSDGRVALAQGKASVVLNAISVTREGENKGMPISDQIGLAKALLNRLDHAAIYLLIAGTYTPVCLVTLKALKKGDLSEKELRDYGQFTIRNQMAGVLIADDQSKRVSLRSPASRLRYTSTLVVYPPAGNVDS